MYLLVQSCSIRGWMKRFPIVLLLLPVLVSIPSDTTASTGTTAFQDTARQQQARGQVMDAEENIPLPGVTVENLVKRKGVLTTANGDYSIAASPGDSLRFSYIGKRSVVAIFRGAAINVRLSKQEGVLSEVVVTGFQDWTNVSFPAPPLPSKPTM
ncbi:carboxypeptidase-like regulatory domain-containing protein [Chitinophaga sedimenti]|uniref:carboxypeptidase-like regulatory domain-containing protein n=1 Tax=Chitinophaga sedimenti TaxID=2033606 RepID=UPI002004B34D|nr:carboxypeptidase-like regulatory domain-containing protein [Chitinophaga sedimenti]MCK7557250.1 carboxypeptidase-like regulatory domain-containing protein [Chitinophaga sedimenti]